MPTESELRDYLTRDPLGLGLADMFALDDDAAIAAVLNTPSRGGLIDIKELSRGDLVALILSDDFLVQKYTPHLPFLQMVEKVPAKFAVADFPDLAKRQGSPAEVAWGEGATIMPGEVSAAAPDAVRADRVARAQQQAESYKTETIAALIAEAKDRIDNAVNGDVLESVLDKSGKKVFVPATDPLSAALRAELQKGPPSDERLAEIAHAEMMRIGGGK